MEKGILPALTEADRWFTRCHRMGLPETESERELHVQDVFSGFDIRRSRSGYEQMEKLGCDIDSTRPRLTWRGTLGQESLVRVVLNQGEMAGAFIPALLGHWMRAASASRAVCSCRWARRTPTRAVLTSCHWAESSPSLKGIWVAHLCVHHARKLLHRKIPRKDKNGCHGNTEKGLLMLSQEVGRSGSAAWRRWHRSLKCEKLADLTQAKEIGKQRFGQKEVLKLRAKGC